MQKTTHGQSRGEEAVYHTLNPRLPKLQGEGKDEQE